MHSAETYANSLLFTIIEMEIKSNSPMCKSPRTVTKETFMVTNKRILQVEKEVRVENGDGRVVEGEGQPYRNNLQRGQAMEKGERRPSHRILITTGGDVNFQARACGN